MVKEEKQETTEKRKKVLVVKAQDVPKQEVRTLVDEDKNEIELITVEEALTEILENTRKVVKAL